MNGLKQIFTLLFFVCVFLVCNSLSIDRSHSSKRFALSSKPAKEIPKYVLKGKCRGKKCSLFAYVSAEDFTKEKLELLAAEFSRKFSRKQVVRIEIYDDLEILNAFLNGRRELSSVQSDRRGWYLKIKKEKINALWFLPDKRNESSIEVVKVGTDAKK